MSTQISQEDHEEAIKELQEQYEKNLEARIAKGVAAALAVVQPTARFFSPLHGKSFIRPIYTSPIKNPLPKSSSAATVFGTRPMLRARQHTRTAITQFNTRVLRAASCKSAREHASSSEFSYRGSSENERHGLSERARRTAASLASFSDGCMWRVIQS